MPANTIDQYQSVIDSCTEIFFKKTLDYGTSWRVLRNISIVDQIYIKAQRIRTIQERGSQIVTNIGDDVKSEFVGIINYSIIGLIQHDFNDSEEDDLDAEMVSKLYRKHFMEARDLMLKKNHDYGEAWRNMSQESHTDLILMKLQRMRQILQNKGKTVMSEGLEANYQDMINYAVFALILMEENSK